MGGGTRCAPPGMPFGAGLSPRGRGNHLWLCQTIPSIGSIPAWAGEPATQWPCTAMAKVYPRVGGGTSGSVTRAVRQTGLSPRGRGNPNQAIWSPITAGSIPAWAGEPVALNPSGCLVKGLSPRGRGNLNRLSRPIGQQGSIPAWAGEPRGQRICRFSSGVYPRVGGGTDSGFFGAGRKNGLSPRGRGNPLLIWGGKIRVRSIPAWAGEPNWNGEIRAGIGVYPRVGGGTRNRHRARRTTIGLSPRGRGNLQILARSIGHQGSIPAWAGEPQLEIMIDDGHKVYPRVGGGTRSSPGSSRRAPGLSPRGRGNPRCIRWSSF